ncbi:MAG TPA: hypothetical protein VMD99_07810 [Terriglobales bacterium]|nr:hypothetical protein [Terriglobales bacterium]
MKRLLAVGGVCGAFLLAGAMSAYAQDEHKDEHHDEMKQEQKHDEHVQARRIDDAHFRAHFGHGHHFAIRHVTIVGGRPHFAYGGYNFEIVEAWPHGWSYNDNCYIDFVDGGYFLFDLAHPGIRISLTVL